MRKALFRVALLAALPLTACLRPAVAQSIAGYTNPPGYTAATLGLTGSAFAIAPNGKFAVAQDDFGGNATITVYDQIGAGRALLHTFEAPSGVGLQFISGIAWRDSGTLVFSENSSAKTVFAASLSTGTVSALAPLQSLPGLAQVAFSPDGTLYAGVANGPGTNAVYTLANNTPSLFASNLGSGYLGGLAFRPSDGALFIGDTNDPFFQGNSGLAHRLNPDGSVAETFSLAGGGGSGLYDIVFDTDSNLYATTGSALTLLPAGDNTARPFGSFSGMFPFPTELDFFGGNFAPLSGGSGRLLVNGVFTEVGGLFAVQPAAVPEPSGFWLLVLGVGCWVFAFSSSKALKCLSGLRNPPSRVRPHPLTQVWERGVFGTRAGGFRSPERGFIPGSTRTIVAAALFFAGMRAAQGQFATQVWAYNSTGAAAGFTNPAKALDAPSTLATPSVPDNSALVSVGATGFLVLGFETPIRRNHARRDGLDFTVFGNAFYVGGDTHLRYQEPGTVEVGLDINGNGYDAGDSFYLLRGSATPTSGAPFSGIDDREATTWGYADVTPTNGAGNPLLPDDPFASGLSAGSAGGDAFSLLWAIDASGNPVTLEYADFVRIRATGSWNTEVDAITLLPDVTGKQLHGFREAGPGQKFSFGSGRRLGAVPASVPEPGGVAAGLIGGTLTLWKLRRRCA